MIRLGNCCHQNRKKHGKDSAGRQRFRCLDCGKTFIAKTELLGGIRIDVKQAEFALRLLLEDSSIRATERLTGLHRDTICKLVSVIGERCQTFLDSTLEDIECDEIEADELWAFCKMKQKTADRLGMGDEVGDIYTFTAIDRATKLFVAFHVGKRDTRNTQQFAEKLSRAVAGRFQLSTDGFKPYQTAIPNELGGRCDWGVIVKVYGDATVEDQRKFSPPRVTDIKKTVGMGHVDESKIGTSRVERSNLSHRMHNRRLTRLTNAFSKKWENHEAMMALFVAWYNFCRPHMSLKTSEGKRTPAMAAGLADHVWTIRELLVAVNAAQ